MKNLLFAVWVALCIGYLAVGLFPYNFFQRNQVAWDPQGPGISFGRHSIVYTEKDIDLGKGSGISVELLLRSEWQRPKYSPSILSLWDGTEPENLTIGRMGPDLMIAVAAGKSGEGRRNREVRLRDGLPVGSPRFLTVTSGPGGTAAYAGGMLLRSWSAMVPDGGGLKGRLLLGDGPRGGRGWQGEIMGAAVFDRVLDPEEVARHRDLTAGGGFQALASEPGLAALYLFDKKSGTRVEDESPAHVPLLIPEFYRVLRRTWLKPVWRDTPGLRDVTVNIVGFVPLGFFYFIYRTRIRPGRTLRNALMTIALAASVSAAIELLQVFLPSRSSTMADLMCNAAGGSIGLVLAAYRGWPRIHTDPR